MIIGNTEYENETKKYLEGYYDSFDPITKKDEILELLSEYGPVVHTREEAGYDWLEDDDCISIVVSRNDEELLYVDLEGEISFGACGWHAHYFPDRRDYNMFISDLKEFLDNRLFVIHVSSNGEWLCSTSSNAEQISEVVLIEKCKDILRNTEFVTKMKKQGYRIECRFMEPSKDVSFDIAPE